MAPRAVCPAVLVVAALALPAPAAHAATVKVTAIPTDHPESCPSACIPAHSLVRVTGRPSGRDDLTIDLRGGSGTFRDARLAMSLTGSGAGSCRAAGREVSCAFTSGVGKLDAVRTGGGDDRVRAITDAEEGLVDGGRGDDVLSGSMNLSGGAGRDRLTAPAGEEQLDDSSLYGGPDSDTFRTRNGVVETIRCGSGRDRVVSADRFDVLRGCERRPRRT